MRGATNDTTSSGLSLYREERGDEECQAHRRMCYTDPIRIRDRCLGLPKTPYTARADTVLASAPPSTTPMNTCADVHPFEPPDTGSYV